VAGRSVIDDDSAAPLLTNYAPPAYDAELHVSSSLGHLQLECVPEDVTEQEEEAEVDIVADEVNDGKETSATAEQEPCITDAAAAAAISSDVTEKCTEASVPHTDTADTLHVESKLFLYF